ncbi:MAG TPA: protocatechuate 3,4-dioxygenase subunit alpha [Bryobacteraceae bacterium]|jgi:protocatechuate 3,4-dioxygenase alpha subunit|nr:protocatechuate 3,4-dioxygenase subunit alpha [Bryobacteraceae bacterium]
MSDRGPVPSQTVGPFFHFCLTTNLSLGRMTAAAARGEKIRIRIRLFDGAGESVPDGMIELWQSDAAGKYRHPADEQATEPDPAFCGFGRLATDAAGACVFDTVRPGRTPDGRGGCQASHINVSIFARGLMNRVVTRLYFEGDPALAEDPVLQLVPEGRRRTLLARPDAFGVWCFDVRLQGADETVFFEI